MLGWLLHPVYINGKWCIIEDWKKCFAFKIVTSCWWTLSVIYCESGIAMRYQGNLKSRSVNELDFKRFWNKRFPQATISDPFFCLVGTMTIHLFNHFTRYPCSFFSATLVSALPLPIRDSHGFFKANCELSPLWDDYPPKRLTYPLAFGTFESMIFRRTTCGGIYDPFLERVYTNK